MSRPALPAGPYLVVGLARSGIASSLALRARGAQVLGTDRSAGTPDALEGAGVQIVDYGIGALEGVAAVIKSPGVPSAEPLITAARERGLAVIGELELAWRLLPNEFVAVTGTNGKTTTVGLLGAIYEAAGLPVAVAGNVGRALSLLAVPAPRGDGPLDPATTVVCEASSFQLEDTEAFAPRVALLLNIAPDHLDRHSDMAAYTRAKLAIFAHQGADDVAVLPSGGRIEAGGRARRVSFGGSKDADMRADEQWLWWRGERFVERSKIRLRGPHNAENAMAAAAAALECGLPAEAIRAALASFPGVAHRLEEVATRDGVLFVNDSKGTNVASTLVALRSFNPGSVRLILGGRGKGEDFGALAGEVAAAARSVYLIGEAAGEIAVALESSGVELEQCGTLERAFAAARADAAPGEVVLLSPACTSFDQFAHYEDRGEEFRRLVLA